MFHCIYIAKSYNPAVFFCGYKELLHTYFVTGMVISVGKVCAVHQRSCALVLAYHPMVEVLDHGVVWWLTKFFGKIVAATKAFFHTFRQGHAVI